LNCIVTSPELEPLPDDLRDAAYAAVYCIYRIFALGRIVREIIAGHLEHPAPKRRLHRFLKKYLSRWKSVDPIPESLERLEEQLRQMRATFATLTPRWLAARTTPFQAPYLSDILGPTVATAHGAVLQLTAFVCVTLRRAGDNLAGVSIPDPSALTCEVIFEAVHAGRATPCSAFLLEDHGGQSLSDNEVRVLLYLLEMYPRLRTQVNIEAGATLARCTVSETLKRLRTVGLVHQPNGPRKGHGLTGRGKQIAQHLSTPAEAN
jgi:hypothetical protein